MSMKLIRIGVGLAMVLVTCTVGGCGSALPDAAVVAGGDAASDQGPLIATGQAEIPTAPHRFSPVSHAPLYRQQGAPAAPAGALPRLVLRYRECFGGAAERQPQPIATGRASSSGGGSWGKGSGTGRSAGAPVASQPQRRSKAPAPKDSAKASRAPAKKAAKQSRGDAAGGASALSESFSSADAAPAEAASPPRSAEPSRDRSEEAKIAVKDDNRDEEREQVPPVPAYDDWGAAIYLSNDDTMSLSSAQRVIYAIDQFLPLPLEHIRPHELLNYFAFDTAPVRDGYDFSVLGGVARDSSQTDTYSLALAVRGRPVDKDSRRHAALTLVVDRSGSMSDEGRMDYLKRGLSVMLSQLKAGDVVNMVLFDDEVCAPVEGFVVGRDSLTQLRRAIDALAPRGSTDLHRGLTRGYDLADRGYLQTHTNRVLLITDALTNTGVTDEAMIATVSRYYDSRRIRLSGIGVGREFNDALLDRLTERGKGAYVFLGSPAEVDAVFGSHFLSLIETTANDVRFRLHLPASLRMQVFYGEESSTVKEDVQEIHYFANTSQLFLSDLAARGGELRTQDEIMLSIEYKDPETEAPLVEQIALRLGDLVSDPRNVAKARLIMAWIDMVAQMAARDPNRGHAARAGGWSDPEGYVRCEQGTGELGRLANGLEQDPEVRRVLALWSKYCARYERPRDPVRRQIAQPPDAWPGAADTRR